MQNTIADSLVLVFTFGMSLRQWRDSGMLEREWALYAALVPHYKRVIVLTYGGEDDRRILEGLHKNDEERSKVSLVCNTARIEASLFASAAPGLIRDMLRGSRSVVVKTNQMVGGEVAVRVVEELRRSGFAAGLLARGGYLWTRFVTYEKGPHSEAAYDAAAREKLLCSAADMVVGTTQEMVDDLAWRYGLDPARTRVIPNYVLPDEDVVSASDRDKGLLIYAGQLVQRKRVDILIDAVASLPPEWRDTVRLEIYGDGPEAPVLRDLAIRKSAPVSFFPRVPHNELLKRMSKCCAYVQASELEGHPKTVLEAMATGTPVIVAEAPGLENVISHGSTGLKVLPDPAAFAHAITELLADEGWREMIGSAAAKSTRAAFGLPVILRQELEVQRATLKNGGLRAAA